MLTWLSFLSWSSEQLVEPSDDYKVWSIVLYYFVNITTLFSYKLFSTMYKFCLAQCWFNVVFGLLHMLVPGKGDYALTAYFLACLNSSIFWRPVSLIFFISGWQFWRSSGYWSWSWNFKWNFLLLWGPAILHDIGYVSLSIRIIMTIAWCVLWRRFAVSIPTALLTLLLKIVVCWLH